MFPHLCSWRVNLSHLQETKSKELIDIIERCEGSKAIIWDDCLPGPVGLLAKDTLLKERNVVKNLPLKPGALPVLDVKNIIFITRPNLKLMDCIAENIYSESTGEHRKNIRKEYYLYFVPRKSVLCTKQLQMKGVYGSFANVGEFPCYFFPVESDLLSMELGSAYKELVVEGDSTLLYDAACGLINLQKLFGRIPKVYGKGDFSMKVWEYAKLMGRECAILNSDKGPIDQMIMLDRSADLMSVLATQLTYEGLIDEIYNINQTTAQFPADYFLKSNDESFQISTAEKKSIIFNSSEELFAELRDKHFNEVGVILSRHAKSISFQLEERHSEKSVQDMKKFVERLPNMLAKKQSVATHCTIAEMIKKVTDSSEFSDDLTAEQEFMLCADIDKPCNYIENLIAKKADLQKVLRLICIQCIAASGFKPKFLDYYKRELIHVYGVEAVLSISNLESAGLLKTQAETRVYTVLRKTLNLTVDEITEISPKDISYVHSLYAPLTVRIVEQCLKSSGWQSLKSVLNILPGNSFGDFQMPLIGLGGRRTSLTSEISQSDVPRVILIFFIGGCTFAEISALRFLSQQEENNVEFVVVTTNITNKNSFLSSFIEKVSN